MIRLVQSNSGGVTVLEQVKDFIIARSPRAQAHKRDFVFARGVNRVVVINYDAAACTSFPISNDRSSRRCRPTRRAARPAPTVARRSTASTGGLPILLKLTAGQADDGRHASDMLDRLGQGQIVLADRGYDSDGLRAGAGERAGGDVKPIMPGRVNAPRSAAASIAFATSSNASSTSSNTTARRRRASKSATPTISPASNSPPHESG